MDDDTPPSTSLNPDSPPFDPNSSFQPPPPLYFATQTLSPLPPNIFPPNFPHTFPTYRPPPLHPYHSLRSPLQFSNTHLVAPPPQPPQLQYSHYFEQQPPAAPPQQEWADSRSIQDATNFVSLGPRISSGWNKNVHRPPVNYYHGNSSSSFYSPAPRIPADQPMTTIVIKNIPNNYTRETVLQFLDDHCKKENERLQLRLADRSKKENEIDKESAYDYVYLAMDYNTGKNKGYAFVNFTSPEAVWKFYVAFNGKPWSLFNSNSNKEIMIVYADKRQGKEANVAFQENLIYCCNKDEYLPLLLDPPSNGSGAQGNRYLVGKRGSVQARRRSPH